MNQFLIAFQQFQKKKKKEYKSLLTWNKVFTK